MSLEDFFNGEKFTLVKKEEYEALDELTIKLIRLTASMHSIIFSLDDEGYNLKKILDISTRYAEDEYVNDIKLFIAEMYLNLWEEVRKLEESDNQ